MRERERKCEGESGGENRQMEEESEAERMI